MAGRCVVACIIFFRDHCHRDHGVKACLVSSYVLGDSGYLLFLSVGPVVSCCCGIDCDVFGRLYHNRVVSLSLSWFLVSQICVVGLQTCCVFLVRLH